MFSINLEYPTFEEEVQVVKTTTSVINQKVVPVFSGQEILEIQQLIRKIPIADNVIEYAVRLVGKTRPKSETAPEIVQKYLDWGAGPRASQSLILGAKAHAAMHGKYSPDIEDVRAVALPILAHRIVKNYKAEAEGISIAAIVTSLL
jgi:MoxR-like ATPase